MTAPKSPTGPAAPPADPPAPAADPPAGGAPVTAEDVRKIVADALAGLKPAGGAPAPGDDVGAQLRAELAKIQDENRSGRITAEARIADLEKALQAATKAGAAATKTPTEPLKKVAETGPKVAVRRVTRFMWGGPEDDE